MHPLYADSQWPTREDTPLTEHQETFSTALNRGLERTGLTLQQIQRRLQTRDVSISLSTLSYWRRGRMRPERPDSLRAIGALEELLDVPPGYLTSLLGPRKPRGRWASRTNLRARESLWDDTGELTTVLTDFNDPAADEITFLTLHEQHHIDDQRRDNVTRVHGVIRAEVSDIRSFVVLHRSESDHAGPPVVTEASGCAVAKRHTLTAQRTAITQLTLGRALRIGETAAFSYQVHWHDRAPSVEFSRGLRYDTKRYLLELAFHPGVTPTRCYTFRQGSHRLPEIFMGEVSLGAFETAHVFAEEPHEAILGMRWNW